MTQTYRMIVIDPESSSIVELQDDASLDNIHKLVGTDGIDHMRIAMYDDGGIDDAWIDHFGLTKGKVYAFLLPNHKDPIAGRMVIIGADREGRTRSCQFPIELLRRDVTWLGLILPEVTWDHTEPGPRSIVTYSRVKS